MVYGLMGLVLTPSVEPVVGGNCTTTSARSRSLSLSAAGLQGCRRTPADQHRVLNPVTWLSLRRNRPPHDLSSRGLSMFHPIVKYLLASFLLSGICATSRLAASETCQLTPPPQQVQWSKSLPIELSPGQVVIVLGAHAEEPECYAAETFRNTVARRYKMDWPIVTETPGRKRCAVEILMGQRTTHAELDAVCSKMNISLRCVNQPTARE